MKVTMQGKDNLAQIKELQPGDVFVMDEEASILVTAVTGFPIEKDNDQAFIVRLSDGALFRVSCERIVRKAEAEVIVEVAGSRSGREWREVE